MLYSCTVPDMNPELETFYISNIKLLRMKNHIREIDEENKPKETKIIPPLKPLIDKPQAIENTANKENVPENKTEKKDVKTELNKVEQTEEVKIEDQWNSRTLKLLKLLHIKFRNGDLKMLNFDELAKKKDRRVMACGFYELLQLNLKDWIVLSQDEKNSLILWPTERLKNMMIS